MITYVRHDELYVSSIRSSEKTMLTEKWIDIKSLQYRKLLKLFKLLYICIFLAVGIYNKAILLFHLYPSSYQQLSISSSILIFICFFILRSITSLKLTFNSSLPVSRTVPQADFASRLLRRMRIGAFHHMMKCFDFASQSRFGSSISISYVYSILAKTRVI